ncbi:MAG: hypothetical protein QXT64_05510 [Desulfurococcaceae archaeon]
MDRTTVYRCRKTGQLKRRIDILIDSELAKKLFSEATKLYGAKGVSRFIEELLYNYFSSKSSEASESSTASKTSSEPSTTHKASRSRRTEVYMSEEEREEIDRLMREVIRRYLSSSVG